jgi:outer membrane protein assembly factor BamB
VAGTAWQDGKLWLATYGGAEINVYDPRAGGEWPVNPRHVLDIGEEQMRPQGMVSDGQYLWTATNAKYGLKGGALVRFDPKTETVKVWRHLVPDHNPTGLRVDVVRRRVYVGTTVTADQGSAPPGPMPGAVMAFDMDREAPAWIARPSPEALAISVLALPAPDLLLVAVWPGYPQELVLIEAATGATRKRIESRLPPEWTDESFLVGSDGALYVACSAGVFHYDLERGPGEQVLAGPVTKPAVHGRDLLFIRGHELGLAENLFESREQP